MPHDVAVVGVGMLSAVGLSAPEVAASVRAGTARFEESPIMDKRFEPFTLAQVPEEALPPLKEELEGEGLTSREARMLRLAEPPLREALGGLTEGAPAPPLILALPEAETTRPLDGDRFLDLLAAQVGGFERKTSEALYRGRAGGVRAIGRAADHLRAGAPFVIAGGVDTYRDLYILGTLDMEQRVKSAANLDGFIPGEGAAFLLLTLRRTEQEKGLRPVAFLSEAGQAMEPGHIYSEETYRGDGLTKAFALTLGNGSAPVREVYSSMNGESHWGKEWGVAFVRHRSAFDEEHGMHHPADCHGDTGAAAGPLMVGLAALAVRDGYRQPPCLVYGSSDRGERAALLVDRD